MYCTIKLMINQQNELLKRPLVVVAGSIIAISSWAAKIRCGFVAKSRTDKKSVNNEDVCVPVYVTYKFRKIKNVEKLGPIQTGGFFYFDFCLYLWLSMAEPKSRNLGHIFEIARLQGVLRDENQKRKIVRLVKWSLVYCS